VPDSRDAHEIVHLIGSPSQQAEEQVASVSSVLRKWGYAIRVLGPLTRSGRRLIASAGVATRDLPNPSGDSVTARWTDARDQAQSVREARPILIHAHGFRAMLAATRGRRAISRPVPVVASPHLLPHRLEEDPRFGIRRRVYRWLLNHSDAVVVPTDAQRDDLHALDEATGERADLVPYPRPAGAQPDSLDLGRRRSLLGITQSAVVVGCIVDGLAQENLITFLDAGASLCMDYPSIEFALIGANVDRELYQNLAHQRGLLGATVFVDPADRLRRAISSLNVLVTPQRGWPSGMLALQALEAEVGVVAIEGGEVAEMLIRSPRVTIAPDEGAEALGEGIIRRLRAAAAQMEPARDSAPDAPLAASFLVSKDFYAIEAAWATPDTGAAEGLDRQADVIGDFDPTRSARALIAVYQRLLDKNASS
jgi:glycosyltransferase involved in cell wall biosynthesis